MFTSRLKKMFYTLTASFCFAVIGFCFLAVQPANISNVYADTTVFNSKEYFSAKVDTKSYNDKDTIFVDYQQKVNITFGKPTKESTVEGHPQIYKDPNEIGNYAIDYISGHFNLKINGVEMNTTEYFNNLKFTIVEYSFSPNYDPLALENTSTPLEYFSMDIDLYDDDTFLLNNKQTRYFPSGEYVLSFMGYDEYKTAIETEPLIYNESQNFSITFYIFQTKDYFSNDEASSPKNVVGNARQSTPLNAASKNYYFFNYTNSKNATLSENELPTITYDANKFNLTIIKFYQGITYTCNVSKYYTDYISYPNTSTKQFINVKFNNESNSMKITFSDLGEYKIYYSFIYEQSLTSQVHLDSSEIQNTKSDTIFVYGYQMFYYDTNDKQKNEFKQTTNGLTSGDNSADVSYLMNLSSLRNTDPAMLYDYDENGNYDSTIRSLLVNETPASTNQPVVSVEYNVNLNQAESYYYVMDGDDWDFEKDEGEDTNIYAKYPFTNNSFSNAGVYLLKVVYTFDYNMTDEGRTASKEYFVQYFYFKISNTTAQVIVESINDDDTFTTLKTNSYTNKNVKVTLKGQSLFDSDVILSIKTKNFGSSTSAYNSNIIEQWKGSQSDSSKIFTENYNYKVELTYGNAKTQISYFTIDKTAFSGVNIFPVIQSTSATGYYSKDKNYPVNFFTNSSVSVQWNEKLSGASSEAFYKYIPFEKITIPDPITNQFNEDNAIPVNSGMKEITGELTSIKYENSVGYDLLTSKSLFTQQGFYIIKISDEAGNWQYVTFCIDKTEIKIWQYSDNQYQTVNNFNVVSADTTLQWGYKKLIDTKININDLHIIKDSWVKDVFIQKYEVAKDNDIFFSSFNNGKLYFAPEISTTSWIKSGTQFDKKTNLKDFFIKLIATINNKEIANEMTYTIYLIDESNKYFNNAINLSKEDYVNFSSKEYSITTSTDAANANILINPSANSSEDISAIGDNKTLTQAGVADSYSYDKANSNYKETVDLRTKYYFSTGNSVGNNILMLSYIFKAQPSELIVVDKVTIYYYEFVENSTTGEFKLSSTATENIIYTQNTKQTTTMSNGFLEGYDVFNINPEYNKTTGLYQTKPGKYVIVRQYTNQSQVDKYDYLIRETSFIVDREKIVSSPKFVGDDYISIIGQYIHIDVLANDNLNKLRFDDIYMAYYNDINTYILKTNKLPVIAYIPIAKYGFGDDSIFNEYNDLKYFFTMTTTDYTLLNRYATIVGDDISTEKSKMSYFYFGDNSYVDRNFNSNANKQKIANSSFDLSVNIQYASTIDGTRTTISSKVITDSNSALNYYSIEPQTNPGYYYVTITQNRLNGTSYPNVSNTFSFMFFITQEPPAFDFVKTDGSIANQDNNGISYTNEESVTLTWQDPTNDYLAKIDINDTGNGTTKGIYYTSNKETKIHYVSTSDIKTTNTYYHSVTIDLSGYSNDTIINFYVVYEGGEMYSSYKTQKQLYIDRQSPLTVINKLISLSTINGNNIGQYTRNYVDENDKVTNTIHKYSTPVVNGKIAYYSFAIQLEDAYLKEYFYAQKANLNGVYNEGYYYYYNSQANQTSMTVSKIAFAKNASASYDNSFDVTSLSAVIRTTPYLEIVEQDLAGNITIFFVYFVSPDKNQAVLEFNEAVVNDDIEETQTPSEQESKIQVKPLQRKTLITYNDLLKDPTQTILVKSQFELQSFNLYSYPWQIIDIDGVTYMKSPELLNNEFYNLSTWSDLSKDPKIVTLSQILTFNASSKLHTLTIVDHTTSTNFVIKIGVTNEILTYATVNTQQTTNDSEGIRITGKTFIDGVSITLSNIKISFFENSSYNNNIIYQGNIGDFSTNKDYEKLVAYSNPQSNVWVFMVKNPFTAYKYEFEDNYGNKIVYYHTFQEPIIENKISGHLGVIYEQQDSKTITWNVGVDDIIYQYSNVDYRVYLKIEEMIYDDETSSYLWNQINLPNSDEQFGLNINLLTSCDYYEVTSNNKNKSISNLILFKSKKYDDSSNYSGGINKFTITLVNVNEEESIATQEENITQDFIAINNFYPKIVLVDKNNKDKTESILKESALTSGQLTIRFASPSFNSSLFFDQSIYMIYNNGEPMKITSGTIIQEAGSYVIKTYLTINGKDVLINISSFNISESSTNFYNVEVYDNNTNAWVIKQSTGKTFELVKTIDTPTEYYTSHYIVNTENYRISPNKEQNVEVYTIDNIYYSGGTTTKFYEISNKPNGSAQATTNINYFTKRIAITYVNSESLLSNNAFYYVSPEETNVKLSGVNSQVIITTQNQNFSELNLVWNTYYGIKENHLTLKMFYGDSEEFEYIPNITKLSDTQSMITITNSGIYTFYFTDVAGNQHKFIDSEYNRTTYGYKLTYINGVAFYLNGVTPIENGFYNDEVTITLPTSLTSLYDAGGKPKIVVKRNNVEYKVSLNKEKQYALTEPGYYTVYFDATINSFDLRQQAVSFTILKSNEYRWTFEFTQYKNYEITSIYKDGNLIDYSNYFDYNEYSVKNGNKTTTNKYLTSVLISLYDEVTGSGKYQLTIRTNSNIANEQFSFEFTIKNLAKNPLTISIEEGQSTTDSISVSFNAYDLYENIGECYVVFENKKHLIDQEYIDSLSNYYVTYNITETGTHFVQLITDSGKVLYSYKVTKVEPLNTVSIIIIVVSALAVTGLIITFTLLRRKMKIR